MKKLLEEIKSSHAQIESSKLTGAELSELCRKLIDKDKAEIRDAEASGRIKRQDALSLGIDISARELSIIVRDSGDAIKGMNQEQAEAIAKIELEVAKAQAAHADFCNASRASIIRQDKIDELKKKHIRYVLNSFEYHKWLTKMLYFAFGYALYVGDMMDTGRFKELFFSGLGSIGSWFYLVVVALLAITMSSAKHINYLHISKTGFRWQAAIPFIILALVAEVFTSSANQQGKAESIYSKKSEVAELNKIGFSPATSLSPSAAEIAAKNGEIASIKSICLSPSPSMAAKLKCGAQYGGVSSAHQKVRELEAKVAALKSADAEFYKHNIEMSKVAFDSANARKDVLLDRSSNPAVQTLHENLGVKTATATVLIMLLFAIFFEAGHASLMRVLAGLLAELKALEDMEAKEGVHTSSNLFHTYQQGVVDNLAKQRATKVKKWGLGTLFSLGAAGGGNVMAAPVSSDVTGYAYPQTQPETQKCQTSETQNTAENTAPQTLQYTQESAQKLSTVGENESAQNLGSTKKVEFNFMAFLADFEGRILSGELDTTAKATREYAREYVDAVFKGDGRTCSNPHADRLAKMCLRNIARRKEGELIDVCKATGRPAGNLGKLRAYMLVNDFNEKMKKG
jgi:hypothetical protein